MSRDEVVSRRDAGRSILVAGILVGAVAFGVSPARAHSHVTCYGQPTDAQAASALVTPQCSGGASCGSCAACCEQTPCASDIASSRAA